MKILIIDIETTGFLEQGGKIVEVGMVELNLTNGKSKVVFNEVCHEGILSREEIESSWIVINGYMSADEILNSNDLGYHKSWIQAKIDAYPNGATAYNNGFDFGFLESRGFTFPKKLPCPMILATEICKLPSQKGFGYKWPKVQECYDFFFPESGYIELHRGGDDALHEAQIVYELYKLGVFEA